MTIIKNQIWEEVLYPMTWIFGKLERQLVMRYPMPSRSSESVWPNANGNCGLPYFDSSVNDSTESSENHRNLCQKRSSDDVPSWRTRWLPFNRCITEVDFVFNISNTKEPNIPFFRATNFSIPETSIFPRGVRTISENCPCYFLFQRVVNSISEMTFSEMTKYHRLLTLHLVIILTMVFYYLVSVLMMLPYLLVVSRCKSKRFSDDSDDDLF